MPISSYSPPDVLLNQELDPTAETQVPRMAACVVGPKYRLSRKSKEEVPDYDFDILGQEIPFAYKLGSSVELKPSGEEVDHAYTKLHVENGRLELANIAADDDLIYLDSLDTPNILKLDGVMFKDSSGDPAAVFNGRVVRPGDKILLSDAQSQGTRVRTVTRLKGAIVPATKGTNSTKADGKFLAGAYNPAQTTEGVSEVSKPSGWSGNITKFSGTFRQLVAPGANYQGLYSDLITVTMVSGTSANVSSASGTWNASGVTVTAAASSGIPANNLFLENTADGVTGSSKYGVSLGTGTLAAGQVFKFVIKGDYTPVPLSTGAKLTSGGTYTGTRDTTYVITVLSGTPASGSVKPLVRVHDTSGADIPQEDIEITLTSSFDLGAKGLTATFGSGIVLRTGDTYYIHAVAAKESTTQFDRVVLDSPAVDTTLFNNVSTALNATFFINYSGEIAATKADGDTVQWVSSDNGVTTEALLTVEVTSMGTDHRNVPLIADYGKLSLSWRSLTPLGSLDSFDSEAQVLAKAGAYDLDNPYGYAVMVAYAAAEGQRVYGVNTGGTAVSDFNAAFQKLLNQDTTCFIAVITDDQEVRELARAHCLSESAPDVKHFRKAYLGIDSPGAYLFAEQHDGEDLKATVTGSSQTGFLTLTVNNEGFDFEALEFGENDLIIFPGFDVTLKVASVSGNVATLKNGPSEAITPEAVCQLWKGDHLAAVEQFLISKSNNLTHRRVTLIWQESGFKITGGGATLVPSKFAAAWAAGRRSALPPHVGLTKQVCPIFDGMPAMYNKYTPDSLNRMASEGLFIIHQKMAGAPVHVRHQLTTDTDKGNLHYEDNITHVVDWLSFQFVDATEPFIGVRNATSKTLSDLRADYTDILVVASQEELDSTYGPVIEGFSNLVISLSPGTRDTFDFSVDVELATPLNRVRITLRGRNGVVTEAAPETV